MFGQRINKYLGLRPSVGPVKFLRPAKSPLYPVTTKPCHKPAEPNASDITAAQSALRCLSLTSADEQCVPDALCTRPAVQQPRQDVWTHMRACLHIYDRTESFMAFVLAPGTLPSFCLVYFMRKSSHLLPCEPLCLWSVIIFRKQDLCLLVYLVVSLRTCLLLDAYVTPMSNVH